MAEQNIGERPGIEPYVGRKTSCAFCERPFERGEVIALDNHEGHTFCGNYGSMPRDVFSACSREYWRLYMRGKSFVARFVRFGAPSAHDHGEDMPRASEAEKANYREIAKRLLDF